MMLIDTGGAAVAHREERATVMKTERDRGGNEAADREEKMLMKMKIVTRAAARDTVKGSKEGKMWLEEPMMRVLKDGGNGAD